MNLSLLKLSRLNPSLLKFNIVARASRVVAAHDWSNFFFFFLKKIKKKKKKLIIKNWKDEPKKGFIHVGALISLLYVGETVHGIR